MVRLLAEGTIEEAVLKLQQRKLAGGDGAAQPGNDAAILAGQDVDTGAALQRLNPGVTPTHCRCNESPCAGRV